MYACLCAYLATQFLCSRIRARSLISSQAWLLLILFFPKQPGSSFLFKRGMLQTNTCKICLTQVHIMQICVTEIDGREICAAHLCTFQQGKCRHCNEKGRECVFPARVCSVLTSQKAFSPLFAPMRLYPSLASV